MQTDPVGYEDQMNLYAYVHNDPLNFADPTGMVGELNYEMDRYAQIIGYDSAAQVNREFGNLSHWEANIDRGAMHDFGGIATFGLAIASLTTPCSVYCAYASFAVSGGLALDHFNHGETASGLVDLATSPFGTTASLSLRLGRKMSDEVSDLVGIVASQVAGEVMDRGVDHQSRSSGSGQEQLGQSSPSNAENGMSAGNVSICSGMGAQKGGCN